MVASLELLVGGGRGAFCFASLSFPFSSVCHFLCLFLIDVVGGWRWYFYLEFGSLGFAALRSGVLEFRSWGEN